MSNNWPSMESRGPSVVEADVIAFEKQLGHSLPEDYRRFLLEVNGGRPALNNIRFDNGNINLLLSLDSPDENDDLLTWTLDQRSLSLLPSPDLLSVGFDNGGGRILLALVGEHRGEVWFENTANPRPEGSNPRVLWHDRRDMWKLADNFQQFMASLKPLHAP